MEQQKRECGSCTKCCDGWLVGEALGHKFWPSKPCHFKGATGCTVYENRPEHPCKTYNCQWLIDDAIPNWMKPNEINAIITNREANGIKYLDVQEAGEKLRVEVLNWIVMFALSKNVNIQYRIESFPNRIGSKEFDQALTNEGKKYD